MAINLTALKTEVLLPRYAGKDQTAIAKEMNTRDIAVTDLDVPMWRVHRRLARMGAFGGLRARIAWLIGRVELEVAANSTIEQRLANLFSVEQLLEKLDLLEMSDTATNTAVTAAFQVLVTENIISAAQRDNLIGLANGNISRTEQLFARGDEVTPELVERARRS